MNSYNIVINEDMIRNVLQTNFDESLDLVTLKQALYFIALGIIPSLYILKLQIQPQSFKDEVFDRFKLIVTNLFIIIILLFSFSKYYASFFREHKALRNYANPTYPIYSAGKYIANTYFDKKYVLQSIGDDAKIINHNALRKIVILVIGETVRADHFSLNGYKKLTNKYTQEENIINFSNFHSCGTSTAISVPCMFSKFTRNTYSNSNFLRYENVLDILNKTNEVAILWRDNNSDSKGVALRLDYENFKSKKTNNLCSDGECRDEGMIAGLDTYIHKNKGKDILIVLHQMGNHGPAYYKRYPKEFEFFKPACQKNQFEKCTQAEISNAYDNALLYTDYFLSRNINFLKKYDDSHMTSMVYISDHGESLGENGIYLHGLPYFMAPDAQTHVGAMVWFNNKMKAELKNNMTKSVSDLYSHDNLFHTLLGLFNVKTKEYDKDMDIFKT